MLAGEPFTDRPDCVCPVLAEFMRTYNDEVDEKRRRDLYDYASKAVGTRGANDVERLRANTCLRWWAGLDKPLRRRVRTVMWGLAPATAARDSEIAYRAAKKAAASRELHYSVLALLDDLVSVGRAPVPAGLLPEQADAPAAVPAPAA